MALKRVAKVTDRSAVDGTEMGHVRVVVDQLPAVGMDDPLDDGPFAPCIREASIDAWNRDGWVGRVAFRIVPDEEQLILLDGRPRLDARLWRNTFRIGNARAHAVAPPFPLIKWTDHPIPLH